ncbi:hypothetical protein [Aureibacter tunicatorum]|uniref:ATP-grasp domain-containing protein n=1 Tax=Aureibacter tunicatorum TaxID=866807 RepID=A0AAE3XLY2_9BACT|nr:hypothetical protein [Aureibacter tunicatorum]MDR6239357.1 hypothetical protein [Aureibacter tunicatorum]BDD04720.1 D-alanine--D-alanine ligase [Aureibacter tunicatorum]
MNTKYRLAKLFNYEYWPFWIFYGPFVLVWLYFSLRSRSFTYFTSANPSVKFGGLFQYSKYGLLKMLDQKYYPRTFFYDNLEQFIDLKPSVNYPLVYKPDIGERGKGVEIVEDAKAVIRLAEIHQEKFMLQEFVSSPHEFGVLYYRYPSGKSGITSIVTKGFLSVTGDGSSTLLNLMNNEIRAVDRIDYLKSKFSERLNEVLPSGEILVLEQIGNHCRGTEFINANYLICDQLVKVFDEISSTLDGFYYGRFDIKAESIDKLMKGEGIKVMEINGVNSEAAHIYDKNYTLLHAYKDVLMNLNMVFEIANENRKHGCKPAKLSEFINHLKLHLAS